MRWTLLVLCACSWAGGGDALPPAALGDAVVNAATGLNTMKISPAWRRISSTVNTSAALRAALRRLQGGAARAAQLVHGLVDRLRVGEGPLVKTTLGTLRGRYLVTRTADPIQYYGFRGVRYAQPPMGKLRFRAPRPLVAWRGRRDALDEGAVCPHRSLLFDSYKGDEDCLFLNVYTPALPDKVTGFTPQLPVMVWLHGGAWSVGSGNSFLYGPDRLVPAGVLLVTLNYRLGALGFLSLEDDEISGNMALKDQIMALEWVRDNIEFFGGDPNRVTLFGESAGAVSVHVHLLSPASRGLFHAAISQSGSALSDWAISARPRETAFDLGRILGIDTNSSAELLGFLRATPSETLVAAANKMSLEVSRAGFPFAPAVDGPGGVLPAPPELLLQDLNPAVPFLTGFNAQEGIIVYRRLRKQPDLLRRMEAEFWRAVPRSLDTSGSRGYNTLEVAADRIRRFYFQNRTISLASIDGVIDLFTDALFMVPTITSIRKQQFLVPSQQVYLYRFAFDGALGLFKRMLGLQHPGACHGDELGYLFHFGNLNFRLDENSPELAVAKRMVKMWTDFAKTGNPTPNSLSKDEPDVVWNPVSPANLGRLNYLDIGGNFTARTEPEARRLHFWDQLYQDFNGDSWT